jgi:hypothetical protein
MSYSNLEHMQNSNASAICSLISGEQHGSERIMHNAALEWQADT